MKNLPLFKDLTVYMRQSSNLHKVSKLKVKYKAKYNSGYEKKYKQNFSEKLGGRKHFIIEKIFDMDIEQR